MIPSILTTVLRYEQDVVLARQRARQVAQLLGFDRLEQTGIATAVSEIARKAFQYAGGGKVVFELAAEPPRLDIAIRDTGPGIERLQEVLDGRYRRRVAWASASSALGGSATGSWCARIRPPARSSS